ncbi:MAG: BrnT family toxin [Thermodesulfobacteriota bacterium]
MRFEWDPQKRKENLRKHKIDFIDAEQMFEGPMLEALDRREEYGEDRYVGTGWIGQRVAVIAFSQPEPDVIRVISLRKATKKERERFEKEIAKRLASS